MAALSKKSWRKMSSDFNPYQAPTTVELEPQTTSVALSSGLLRARTGLYVAYYGVVSVLLSMIGIPLLAVGMQFLGMRFGAVLVSFAATGMFAGWFAIFTGQVMCAFAPEESGAKSMAIGAVLAQVVSMLAVVGNLLAAVLGVNLSALVGDFLAEIGPGLVPMLAGGIGMFLFVIFLRRLNRHLGNERLMRSAGTLIWLMVLTIVGYLGIAVLMAFRFANQFGAPTEILGISVLVFMVLALVTFIKFSNLMLYTAKAIGRLAKFSEIG